MIESTPQSDFFDAALLPLGDTGLPRPSCEIAALWPNQGEWSEAQYLSVALDTNHLVELVDGHIEVLPMPKRVHQLIVQWMFQPLDRHVRTHALGVVVVAAFSVRLRNRTFREPDIVFMLEENRGRISEDYFEGADLAIEVVSPDPKSRNRDYVEKLSDYARAGVSEYWIVDPEEQKITVLTLAEGAEAYAELGVFTSGQSAGSKLLDGFSVQVQDVFTAAQP
ncbi:hypothetical protein Pla175_51040 [Pirellulimonas nuda]|uniref:Putative restriction endonuclease domain-containing protein n=1 Tax=Pirellulimonas nuda TaxID=2528009 RepID=A0A518DJM2_9BACT|nr:Uma2 family endonuclease [Pirellulimonas nuda]QDU91674.1 hypothetical protein Pla175_51040 [Pirellulimonas nuda]